MKREQRAPWLALIVSAKYWAICSLCRYADWFCDDECDCKHRLSDELEWSHNGFGVEPGEDCWGFRPEKGLTLDGARDRLAEWGESEED